MGKTLNAFFKFVFDDPIMLGLCIAILVLVILFIVVLILGKRADKKEDRKNKKLENLVKTEVDLKALNDTENATDIVSPNVSPVVAPAEYSVNLDIPADTAPINTGEIGLGDVAEIPVNTEESFKLEIPTVENFELTPNMAEVANPEVPVQSAESILEADGLDMGVENFSFPSFEEFNIEAPSNEEIAAITQELTPVNTSVTDDLQTLEATNTENTSFSDIGPGIFEVPNIEPNISAVPEVEPLQLEEADSVLQGLTIEEPIDIEMPIMTEPSLEEEPMPLIVESSVSPIEDSQKVIEPSRSEDSATIEEAKLEMPEPIAEEIKEEETLIDVPTPPVEDIPNEQVELGNLESSLDDYILQDEIDLDLSPKFEEEDLPKKEEHVESIERREEITIEEIPGKEDPTDLYAYDNDLPDVNFDDFSRTAIIRHIPILETNTKNILEDRVVNRDNEDSDDLDLPKLSSNQNTSVLNSLKGESFDIRNDS